MERYLSSVVAATFSYYKVYKEVDVVDSSFQGVGQVNQITPGSVHLSRSVMSDSLRPHGLHAAPGFPVHHQLPELAQTLAHQVSDAIHQSHPPSSPSPAFNLFCIMVFSKESVLQIRWPKYCSFSFSISPSNEYSGLISFRIYLFDLLAVQGTLKSLL